MPRLFTGLEIPDDLSDALARLRGGLGGARWIDPEDYHITLRFIGDVEARLAEEIADRLSSIRRPYFRLCLEGLGVFGGARPHSLYVAVRPCGALEELQADHERLMRKTGVPPLSRKFMPHITLARLRHVSDWEVADWISSRSLPPHTAFMQVPFLVGQFTLFSAKAQVGGGPYLAEESYPLQLSSQVA